MSGPTSGEVQKEKRSSERPQKPPSTMMMVLFKIAKLLFLVVVMLAATGGIIAKTKPELFLKVPGMGFVLYFLSGNPLPPYFSPVPFEEMNFREFFRDGDVIVAAAAKSGTNWMLHTVNQLRATQDESTRQPEDMDVLIETPWIGFVPNPGEKWETTKNMLSSYTLPGDKAPISQYWNHKTTFRVFKSHYGPLPQGFSPTPGVAWPAGSDPNNDVMPVRKFPNVKFIAMVRNPKDQAASFWPFFAKHSDSFRAMWGGFPPVFKDIREMAGFLMTDGKSLGVNYIKAWWPYRNDDNVLLLHYANVKKNPEFWLKKIANFVGAKNLSKEQTEQILDKTSFDWMKKHQAKWCYNLLWNSEVDCIMKKDGIINQGVDGAGKKIFADPELEKKFDHFFDDELSNPALAKWVREGGDMPAGQSGTPPEDDQQQEQVESADQEQIEGEL